MHWTMKTLTILTLAGPLALIGCDTHDQHQHEEGSAAKEHGDQGGSEKKEDGSDSRY